MRRREFMARAIGLPLLNPFCERPKDPSDNKTTHVWLLGTEQVSYELSWHKAVGLRLDSLKNRATGYEWAGHEACGFAFESGDQRIDGVGHDNGFEFQGYERRDAGGNVQELELRFLHPELELELLLVYTSFPGSAVIEHHCRIRNAGHKTIPGVRRFDPLFFTIRIPAPQLQARACRIDRYEIERLPMAGSVEIGSSIHKSPNGHAGFVVIENPTAQEELFFGVEWGAAWVIRFEERPSGIQVSAGLTELVHNLAPGDTLDSPRVFVGVAHGDLDSAAQTMQTFLEKNVFPPRLDGFPWVVYDVWGTRNEGLEERLLKEIDFAAELGIEAFYHDAAWYAGSSKNGSGDWFTGLGTYEQDREKFPHGLRAISSRVHERGMKFGIWVDCAIVDEKLVPGKIPERWLALHDGHRLRVSYKPYQASIIQLCLGNPEVVEHIQSQLGRLVLELNLDWIKWDSSGETGVCNRTDHGHQAGDGAYFMERGRYSVWSFLRAKFPELVLEECGGVTRQDLGLARYCRCHWMDDATFPSRHVRENILSASFVYPCYYQGSWVVREEEIGNTKDPDFLDTIFRSRMIGLFGFGTLYGKLFTERVSLFPEEALQAARRNIPLYKRYRHLLSEKCFHLTAPSGSPEGWQAIEFCKPDGSEAVVLAFRNGSYQRRIAFPLKGLKSASQYSVESANTRTNVTKHGSRLSVEGAILDLPKPTMSEILFLKQLS
jgi:alpha-galactosidase